MIRSWKGYRFVSEMSLSRDVLITLIRSEHGYRYVIKMSLLSTLSFKKVKLTLMSMSMFLTWSRMPWKYQESCIYTMFCKHRDQVKPRSRYVSHRQHKRVERCKGSQCRTFGTKQINIGKFSSKEVDPSPVWFLQLQTGWTPSPRSRHQLLQEEAAAAGGSLVGKGEVDALLLHPAELL